MSAHNTPHSYGRVARVLHWLTAGLILLAWPIGWWAEGLPYATGEELALKAQAFSVHKTLGVAAFFVAVARILWALGQRHPEPVSVEHRLEVWVAAMVHWALYAAMVIVPLSGWLHHAATEGFAPILWPFGDNLPFVQKSESFAAVMGAVHIFATKAILVLVVLHVAGALKHAVIDRDGTLSRMLLGRPAGQGKPAPTPFARGLAFAAWAVLVAAAVSLTAFGPKPPVAPTGSNAAAVEGGNWLVETGTLGISVTQMGSVVKGNFTDWQAEIQFDPEAQTGNRVRVEIATESLSLGSVAAQAKGPNFLNVGEYPKAVFAADIRAEGTGYLAEGTLSLAGADIPVRLPFTLEISGDQAKMVGQTRLDRRDYGVGKTYADEKTLGFGVDVEIELTAKRR